MRPPKHCLISILLVLPLVAAAPASAEESTRTPMLQPGKTTLFQRVLTRPGARLADRPGTMGSRLVDAFSRFYVYSDTEREGQLWIEVGLDTRGTVIGWLPERETVPWRQQMALAFTNPGADRQRALFFDSWSSLDALLSLSDPGAEAARLTEQIASGGRDARVVAIEPDRFIDINTRFYLLPILGFEEVFTNSGHLMRGLRVASVAAELSEGMTEEVTQATPTIAPAPTPRPESSAVMPQEVSQLSSFRSAVVFIIDSTISMQPYIDAARAVAEQVYRRIEESGMIDKVAFGLVAFRAPTNNPARASALEYVSRVYADPSLIQSGPDFLQHTATLSEARVSTDHFDEDPFAGIMTALEEIPWNRFGARYAVLITDAGALEGTASTTGLHAEQVRSEAAEKGVALMVLHLKTPPGTANHASAESQYRTLAYNPAIQRTLYYPVARGAPQALSQTVATMADTVIENIAAAARGDMAAGSARTARHAAPPDGSEGSDRQGGADTAQGTLPREISSGTTPTPAPEETSEQTRLQDSLREATLALGHAMQLAYLGRKEGTRAPTVFEGWISDRDVADPTLRTLDERVLLTKDELSTLHTILKQIVDAADTGMLQPDSFFDSLRSIAAQYGRDPGLATSPQATRLADLGLLGEYLEGLPYKSDVMALDQDTWSRWGTQRQFEFISRLKGKIKLYERYNADSDRWVSLAEGNGPGEWVYPVPLRDLP